MSLNPIAGYKVISQTNYTNTYSNTKKWVVEHDQQHGNNRLVKLQAINPTFLNRLEGLAKGILKFITFNLAFSNSSFSDLFAGRKWIYLNVQPDDKVNQTAKNIFTNSVPYASDIADQQYQFLSVNAPQIDPSTLKRNLLPSDFGIVFKNSTQNNKLQILYKRTRFEVQQGKSEFEISDFNPYVQTTLKHVKILTNFPGADLPPSQLKLTQTQANSIAHDPAQQLPVPVSNSRNTGFYFIEDQSNALYFQNLNGAYLVTDANRADIGQNWHILPMLHASENDFAAVPKMDFKQAAKRLEGLNQNQGFIYRNTRDELKIMYRDPQDPTNIKTVRFTPASLEEAKYALNISLVSLK